jgi:hypothetical protein
MPEYRRNRVPGGTFFLTVDLLNRRSDLLVTRIIVLRDAIRQARIPAPFRRLSYPKSVPTGEPRSPVMASRGERGIWQRLRFAGVWPKGSIRQNGWVVVMNRGRQASRVNPKRKASGAQPGTVRGGMRYAVPPYACWLCQLPSDLSRVDRLVSPGAHMGIDVIRARDTGKVVIKDIFGDPRGGVE